MEYAQIARLLDPAPLPLEMGYERLADGVLHVAIRTDMPGCSGAMLAWWFGFRPSTREYVWWHPLDHIGSAWADTVPGTHIGSVHLAEERFGASPAELLSIQFRDPTEVFAASALAQAHASGAVSAVLCAHGGQGHDARRTADGKVIGTRLIHLARDTATGLALRTHFFLGLDLPALGVPPAAMATMFPDALAPDLLRHCYEEFTFLARFLPSLYAAENRATVPVRQPW